MDAANPTVAIDVPQKKIVVHAHLVGSVTNVLRKENVLLGTE